MIYVAHIKLHEVTEETDNITSEKLLISAANMSNALDILGFYAGSKELEIEWFKKVGDKNNENIVVIASYRSGDSQWTAPQSWNDIVANHEVGTA